MLVVRSLVAAVFLCLLAFAPQAAAADDRCPSGTSEPADLELSSGDLACADLHGAYLASHDLSQADLSGANLRDAILIEATLVQADLTGADLRGADLTDAKLTQADLRNADLRGANLTDVDLIQADLTGADLRGATLSGVRAGQVTGLTEIRVDPIGPGAYVQVGYSLLGPAAALALIWWRHRFTYLLRNRHITPVRPADLTAVAVGVPVAMAGLYLLCCGAIRAMGGWLWAADPGPLDAAPVRQLWMGGAAIVVSAFVLAIPRRRRSTTAVPADPSQLAVGRPTPGRQFPELSFRARSFAAFVGVLGLMDLVGLLVMWLLEWQPAHGPWGEDSTLGHLVVVGVATVVLVHAANPAPDPEAEVKTLSGFVLVPGAKEPYVWLSGASTNRQPANRALPWQSLEHVHLIRTLGATSSGTVMITVRPPDATEPVEYPTGLPVSKAAVGQLHALLPQEKLTEVGRAPSAG